MSENNNEILERIASSLKSIDERLGLLLMNTKLSPEPEAWDKDYSGALFRRQSTFSREYSATVGYWYHEVEEEKEDRELEYKYTQRTWRDALGLEVNPMELDNLDPDELAQCSTGLTFCDLANRFKGCGLPKHRTQRYDWMRRKFRKIKQSMPGKSPYNKFLAGKAAPSKIPIDFCTASLLVPVIDELIRSGKLTVPK